jgi:hypothetical protein
VNRLDSGNTSKYYTTERIFHHRTRPFAQALRTSSPSPPSPPTQPPTPSRYPSQSTSARRRCPPPLLARCALSRSMAPLRLSFRQSLTTPLYAGPLATAATQWLSPLQVRVQDPHPPRPWPAAVLWEAYPPGARGRNRGRRTRGPEARVAISGAPGRGMLAVTPAASYHRRHRHCRRWAISAAEGQVMAVVTLTAVAVVKAVAAAVATRQTTRKRRRRGR